VAVAAPAPAPAPTPAAIVMPYSPPKFVAPAPEQNALPLWREAPRQGITLYLFVGAALVVLIMAMMAVNSLNLVRFPWQSAEQIQVRPTPSPTQPLTVRSDYARAERFLNVSLAPAVVALNQTLTTTYQTCTGTLTISCHDAIVASEQQLKKVLAVIDRADIAPCIAPGMSKVRKDLATMDDAAQLALKGYTDNKSSAVVQDLYRLGSTDAVLKADSKAVDQALKTQCSPDQTGP
jgi:hypothetical protein